MIRPTGTANRLVKATVEEKVSVVTRPLQIIYPYIEVTSNYINKGLSMYVPLFLLLLAYALHFPARSLKRCLLPLNNSRQFMVYEMVQWKLYFHNNPFSILKNWWLAFNLNSTKVWGLLYLVLEMTWAHGKAWFQSQILIKEEYKLSRIGGSILYYYHTSIYWDVQWEAYN